MNQEIFLAINSLAARWPWLDAFAVFLANEFIYLFAIAIAALWLVKQYRLNVFLALASAIVSRLIIVETIKRLVNNPRPYEVVLDFRQLLEDSERGLSFPSGHTVIFFSFAFAFWGTKLFWPLFVLASLASVARVFVGVHFPQDIAASFVIAAATVWIVHRFLKKMGY